MHLLSIGITKHFDQNNLGQDYFIGDIHGNHTLLIEQLKKIQFNFTIDRLFAVGDIIDRGDQSEQCIELLIEPWFHSVLGNHEYLFLQGFNSPNYWELLLKNGGQWTNKWLDNPNKLLAWAHLIRIKMPLSMSVKTEFGVIGITHAEAPANWHQFKNLKITEQGITPFIWHRRNLIQPSGKAIINVDAVVHGHNSLAAPIVINNQIWIDTLQKTGSLTILKDTEIFSLIKKNN